MVFRKLVSLFRVVMRSEEENITVAAMAEEAAEKARSQILALYRRAGGVPATGVLANNAADGARFGAISAFAGKPAATMSRPDADMYAHSCAAGAVVATLGNIVSTFCGTETGGELNEISCIAAADAYYNNDEIDEINIFAAYAGERVEDKRSNNWLSYFILAFSLIIAIVSVFVVVFRAV